MVVAVLYYYFNNLWNLVLFSYIYITYVLYNTARSIRYKYKLFRPEKINEERGGGTEPTKCMWSMNEWKNKKQIKTTKCKGLPNDAQNLTKKHEESKEDRKGTALKEGGKGNEICNQ